MHEIKALVDLRQCHRVRDHWVDLDLARHVPVNDFRNVCATAGAAEGRALPYAAGDQLERTRGDFRPSRGNPDND
jgi:hypothetical protein